MPDHYLDDEFLINFILKEFKNLKFLKRKENANLIKNKLKKLSENEKKIIDKIVSEKWEGFIPKSQQLKIEIIKELWELFLREALYCLRSNDPKDPSSFKQDFGLIEIKQYFEKFSEFEEVLHGTDRYYRDHSLHVVRVFFLGFYLLTSILSKTEETDINFNSIEIFDYELKDHKLKIEEIQSIWVIIALTHDLGYPIEKIDQINEKITGLIKYFGPSGIEEFKYRSPLQNQFLNDFILKFISSKLARNKDKENYCTVIQNKYYLKFAKAFENFSHGIMSCILLMKHLVYFKESDYSHSNFNALDERDAIQFSIRKTILRSIASHDNEDIYHIFPNNYLFLLTFCDDLQEWDRPRITNRFQKSEKILVNRFDTEIISFENHLMLSKDSKITEGHLISFARNVKKYVKLIRSGPDSNKRTFIFKYNLNVKIEDQLFEIFSFQYPPEKDPFVHIPLLNSDDDFIKLFLDFVRANYEVDEGILRLLEKLNSQLIVK